MDRFFPPLSALEQSVQYCKGLVILPAVLFLLDHEAAL